MAKLTETQRRDALRLIRAENVGPITYHKLVEFFKNPSEALAALPDIAARGGIRGRLKIPKPAIIEKEIEQIEALNGRFIVCGEPEYPQSLAATADPPPVLTIRGHTHLLAAPRVAIVGTRNASMSALKITETLADGLGHKGYAIVSGMARGIDTAAHWHGFGTGTIAVLASGIDVIYPKENEELYERICGEGLVISENACGTQPMARHFPRRNRIISGLSLGVIVVEAAMRSGSLITARLAGEQGREIMAVPGSPLDPRCRGSNNLIRQGAALVENLEDALDVLRPLVERFEEPIRIDILQREPSDICEPDEAARQHIFELLGTTPVSIDELIQRTDYPPSLVHMVIIELELAGRLIRDQIGISLNFADEGIN